MRNSLFGILSETTRLVLNNFQKSLPPMNFMGEKCMLSISFNKIIMTIKRKKKKTSWKTQWKSVLWLSSKQTPAGWKKSLFSRWHFYSATTSFFFLAKIARLTSGTCLEWLFSPTPIWKRCKRQPAGCLHPLYLIPVTSSLVLWLNKLPKVALTIKTQRGPRKHLMPQRNAFQRSFSDVFHKSLSFSHLEQNIAAKWLEKCHERRD